MHKPKPKPPPRAVQRVAAMYCLRCLRQQTHPLPTPLVCRYCGSAELTQSQRTRPFEHWLGFNDRRMLRAARIRLGGPMTLADLSPHWVGSFEAPTAHAGLSFLCPCCRVTRLAVFFDVPVCGAPAVDLKTVHRQQAEQGHLGDHHIGNVLWHRAGETFETLTLTPSIDASAFGHWHGSITNGQLQ